MFDSSRIVFPSRVSERRDFYDRSAAIDAVSPLLLNQSYLGLVILLGERRSGKTSLLRFLIDSLEMDKTKTFVPVLLSWDGVATADELIRSMLSAVRNYLAKEIEGTNALGTLPPALDTSVQDAIEALRTLLALVPGRKLVLGIDEFDTILDSARQMDSAKMRHG